jgi:hypothetical protein
LQKDKLIIDTVEKEIENEIDLMFMQDGTSPDRRRKSSTTPVFHPTDDELMEIENDELDIDPNNTHIAKKRYIPNWRKEKLNMCTAYRQNKLMPNDYKTMHFYMAADLVIVIMGVLIGL